MSDERKYTLITRAVGKDGRYLETRLAGVTDVDVSGCDERARTAFNYFFNETPQDVGTGVLPYIEGEG